MILILAPQFQRVGQANCRSSVIFGPWTLALVFTLIGFLAT